MATPESGASPYASDDMTWMQSLLSSTHVRVELEDQEKFPTYDYALVNLTNDFDANNIAAFRTLRMGGLAPADIVLRRNVCAIVGAITVAGGHIEAEMKRIIMLADGKAEATFADVDYTWTQLEKRLDAIAESDDPLAEPVAAALVWCREHKIKETRDDAVHSAWSLYDVGHIQRSRFRRKKDGTLELGTLEDYEPMIELMFRYARHLSTIGIWPMAVLPPLPDQVQMPNFTLQWSPEEVGLERHAPPTDPAQQ